MRITNSLPQDARKSPGVFLSLAALILLILLYLAVRIQFQTDHHKKHSQDVSQTENCLNRHGVSYAIQEAATGRIHLICVESPSEFYDVIYKDRGTLDGITAFRVTKLITRSGTLEFHTVEDYVTFLINRGDRLLPTSQFSDPFIFIFP